MMKKGKREIVRKIDKIAEKLAVHYANVTCPLITYQQKLPKEVQKLRK